MGHGHPECPERLLAIESQLQGSEWDHRIVRKEPPLAEDVDVLRVHPQSYLDRLHAAVPARGYAALDPDTCLNPSSLRAAYRAAGAAVAATDAVISGEATNAFCGTRPPGHHARIDTSMGFCIFNNVGIAVRHALEVHGLERVAIVDFDVHHGNGTEEIFAGDDQVLMVGSFQHPFYPYSGTRNRASNMINVPLPAGADGQVMREAAEQIWLPALEAFQPQMIFISAGFDAHEDDPLGQMCWADEDYHWLTQRIMEVAQRHARGRIVSCLEGGYDLAALARSVAAHLDGLTGDSSTHPD